MVEGLPIGVNFGKRKNRTALKLWQRAMLLKHLLTLDMRELDQSACRLSLPQPDISTVHCPPGCNRIGSSLCSKRNMPRQTMIAFTSNQVMSGHLNQSFQSFLLKFYCKRLKDPRVVARARLLHRRVDLACKLELKQRCFLSWSNLAAHGYAGYASPHKHVVDWQIGVTPPWLNHNSILVCCCHGTHKESFNIYPVWRYSKHLHAIQLVVHWHSKPRAEHIWCAQHMWSFGSPSCK